MQAFITKHGFDKYKIIGTVTASLLIMCFSVVVRPIFILTMQVTLYTWVTFILDAPLGYLSQHLSDKLVSAMSDGGHIQPNHGSSLLLDALRTLIFAAVEAGVCVLVILYLVLWR